jgi:hypothetical protein
VRRWCSAFVAGAVLVGAVGCGSDGSDRSDAFAWIPDDAKEVELTNWAAINKQLGAEDSSDSTQYVHALTNAPILAATPSMLARYAVVLDSSMGFDLRNVSWEVRWTNSEGAATLVHLESGTSIAQIEAALKAAQFAKTTTSKSGELWVRPLSAGVSGVPFTAVRIFKDDGVLEFGIGSSAPAITPGSSTWDDSKKLASIRDGLRSITTAAVALPPPCEDLPTGTTPSSQLNRVDESALTFTASGDNIHPKTLSVFPSGTDVNAEVKRRVDLAKTGTSLVSRRPYSDYIHVKHVTVHDQTADFDLEGSDTRRLLPMFIQRDWPFTACHAQ